MKSKLIFGFWVLLFFVFSLFPCFAQSSYYEQLFIGNWVEEDEDYGDLIWIFKDNGSGYIGRNDITYSISVDDYMLYYSFDNVYWYSCRFSFSFDGRRLVLIQEEGYKYEGHMILKKTDLPSLLMGGN